MIDESDFHWVGGHTYEESKPVGEASKYKYLYLVDEQRATS